MTPVDPYSLGNENMGAFLEAPEDNQRWVSPYIASQQIQWCPLPLFSSACAHCIISGSLVLLTFPPMLIFSLNMALWLNFTGSSRNSSLSQRISTPSVQQMRTHIEPLAPYKDLLIVATILEETQHCYFCWLYMTSVCKQIMACIYYKSVRISGCKLLLLSRRLVVPLLCLHFTAVT